MGESIHDLMMDARLKRLPVPIKPYHCAACEEDEIERLDHSDKDSRYNYERYSHNFDCGGDNYAHIQWDYKKQRWVDTQRYSSGSGAYLPPGIEVLMSGFLIIIAVMIIGIIVEIISPAIFQTRM